MNWLSLIPLLISSVSTVNTLVTMANSNDDLVTKIKSAVPALAPMLEAIGGALFPNVKPQLHAAAAAMAAFNPDINKWIQSSLNVLVEPSPNLVVDGLYGPKTRAAVESFQKQAGLTTDGWAGNLTQNALMLLMGQRLGSTPEVKS